MMNAFSRLETKINADHYSYHWLQRDLVQLQHFQHNLIFNATLNQDRIQEIRIDSMFLRKLQTKMDG